MNALLTKISILILAAACVILTVDRARQSLRLNGVAARIAEKSAELERERAEFKTIREKLQNEIRERDERFRLVPGREPGKTGLPQIADPKDSSLARMASKLAKESSSPVRLSQVFRKLAEEKQLLPDVFRIDPASGLVVSRAASLLTLAARSAGMEAKTSLIWDMRDFRPHAVVEILPSALPDHEPAAPSISIDLSENRKKTPPDPRYLLHQTRAESVVFSFEADLKEEMERILLPPGSIVPCGGLYLNFFTLEDPSVPWFLEYEFPEDMDPKDANLQAVALEPGMNITSHVSERIQSFLVRPGSGRHSALLIGGDKTFFPLRITASRLREKFPLKKSVK